MGFSRERVGRSALIVVDVQNDFCHGGSLAVPDGDAVVEPLNRMIRLAHREGMVVVASRDWHPARTVHFKEYGGKWPPHCIQGTYGAEFHPLLLKQFHHVISKGMGNSDDGYSAFEGVCLQGELDADLHSLLSSDWGVTKVYVGGLAPDYCVKATVLDALKLGYETHFLICASRGVDPITTRQAITEMHNKGAVISYAPYNFAFGYGPNG